MKTGQTVRVLLVLMMGAGLAGCTPLRSVRATAQLGARLTDSADVLANGPRYCNLIQAATQINSAQALQVPPCDTLRNARNAHTLIRASNLLARYALILNSFVDPSDITFKQVTASWPQSSPATDAFSTAAVTLLNVVTKNWRQKKIEQYVQAVDLEEIFRGLEQHVDLMLQILVSLRGGGDDPQGFLWRKRQSLLAVTALHKECQQRKQKDVFCGGGKDVLGNLTEAGLMELWNVQSWVEGQVLALLRYQRTLRSFHAAYSTLRRSKPRTWDNKEVFGLIGQRIEEIAMDTARTREHILGSPGPAGEWSDRTGIF